MKKDLGVKQYLCPQLVMILATYDKDNNPNVMNAAWGGVADYNKIIVCLDKNHKTTANLQINGELTISIGDAKHVKECDYVGLVSLNDDANKMAKSKFTTTKAKHVNAPLINELPLTFECKVLKVLEEELYLLEIVNVSADENILDKDDKLDLERFMPIVYESSTHGYYKVTTRVGNAFFDGNELK